MTGGSFIRKSVLVLAIAVAAVAATSALGASRGTPVQLGLLGKPNQFDAATGQHSTTRLQFIGWGQDRGYANYFTKFFGSMLSVPDLAPIIQPGSSLTPLGIAQGKGDAFLLRLNKAIAAFGGPMYVRPLAEMNGHWNSWCAYNANGTLKGPAYSTSAFKKAFARIYLMVHGDPNANAKLARLGMPPMHGQVDPAPNVQVIWNPQGFGSPDVPGNSAAAYYPGGAFVDVVGDDLYDIGGRASWPAADALYKRYPNKPFAFPEWGLWGIDDPSFIQTMARFVKSHPRTQVLSYFNGKPGSIWDIRTKPSSLSAYRRLIAPLG